MADGNGNGGAKINKAALQALQKPEPADDAGLTTTEYGPSVKVLQTTRLTGSMDQILNTVGRFNPDRITMRQRHQMRRDPMIAMGLHFIGVPIINADFHFECDDPRVSALVDHYYRKIHQRLLSSFLTSLPYGYAAIVKRFSLASPDFTYDDPDKPGKPQPVWPEKTLQAVVWNDPQVLPPDGAEPKFKADGRTFDGIKHTRMPKDETSGGELEVPASHSLWVTNERDGSFGDWYGYPRTGYALRYWWSYWYRWLLGDRHFEQDADPPLVVRVPEGPVPDPNNPGHSIQAVDLGVILGGQIKNGSVISIPSDAYEDLEGRPHRGLPKWDFQFLKGGENMDAFQKSFEYLDVMKLRALLIPEQALVEGKGGTSSRNVAATYGAAFAESEGLLAAEFDQLINDYLIPDLVSQNFIDAPPCTKVTTGFRDEDMDLVNQIIETLAQNDPASLHLDIRELVRSVGLPQLAPDDPGQTTPQPGQVNIPGGGTAPDPALQPAQQPGQQPGQQPAPGGANNGGVTIDGTPLAADLPDNWQDLMLGDPDTEPLLREVLDLRTAWLTQPDEGSLVRQSDREMLAGLDQLRSEMLALLSRQATPPPAPPNIDVHVHPPAYSFTQESDKIDVHVAPPSVHADVHVAPADVSVQPPDVHVDVAPPDVHVAPAEVHVAPAEVTVQPAAITIEAPAPMRRRLIKNDAGDVIGSEEEPI